MTDKPSRIVRGQRVRAETHAFAKSMRKDMSPIERILWSRLRGKQLNGFHFRRQQIISGYIADFYCHQAGLAVEVDGDSHDDPMRDAERDLAFEQKGISVLRFSNLEVLHHLDGVLETILQRLTAP
jgi:very-short-patch-repair endonuclease